MAKSGITNWRGPKVVLKAIQVTDEALTELALRVETEAKKRVVETDQVDTGFMLNAIYTVAPGINTYSSAWQTGIYKGKDGTKDEHRLGPQQTPPDHVALVAAGAEYSIYRELKQPFLYYALQKVAAEDGEEVLGSFEDLFHD